MDAVAEALGAAARASTIDELGAGAFPALARALHACPVFLGEVAPDFPRSRALAGQHPVALGAYLRDFMIEDPLGQVAFAATGPVTILEQHVDRRTVRASRAYNEFHRIHDFEHHMMVRFFGAPLPAPGALIMGFTRGRRLPEFGAHEARIAALVVPALRGAAQRILGPAAARPRLSTAANTPAPAPARAPAADLTPAERAVLSSLSLGLSNADIARRLCVSVETVKTHLYRAFRKLGVTSRTQALVALGYAHLDAHDD